MELTKEEELDLDRRKSKYNIVIMFLVFAVCIILAVALGKKEEPVPIDIFSMYLLSIIASFIYRESYHQPPGEDKDDYGW